MPTKRKKQTPQERARRKPTKARMKEILAEREAYVDAARDDFLKWCKLSMPDPELPEDPELTRFEVGRHHEVFATTLEEVEAGNILRLIVTVPPRHGKTEQFSTLFPPWFVGRDPYRSVITGTYSGDYAEDIGRNVKELMQSPLYKEVFPEVKLRKGGVSNKRIQTTDRGALFFVGRGGATTGRGGHLIIVDDPIKDAEEAKSVAVREKCWNWFTRTLSTRQMVHGAAIIIVMCMTGDTPVLMANGRNKPLRDIRPGDKVATYNNGRLSTSTVKNHISHGVDQVYEIKTISGTTVKANERHPFLIEQDGERKWVRLRNLRPGQRMLRVNGENGKGRDANGTAAISQLDAEAIAHRTTTRSAVSTVYALPLQRALRKIESEGSRIVTALRFSSMSGWLRSRAENVRCAASHLAAMFAPIGEESCASTIATTQARFAGSSVTTATLPWRIPKRQKPQRPSSDTCDFILDEIVSIAAVEPEEVFDVEIAGTENFIANGLVSHNTRWHEDDIVGRLTDPKNHCYSKEEASRWKIIDLPFFAEANDPLGRKENEVLWPERFPAEYGEAQRRLDAVAFSALYQGRPTPADGHFFKRAYLKTYAVGDRPADHELSIYAASDHAVGTDGTRHDKNVLLIFGICPNQYIWLLDCMMGAWSTDRTVDIMLDMMKRWKPIFWFAEDAHIAKSIGPFLLKMKQERVMAGEDLPTVFDPVQPTKNKVQRAQSIQGLMAMGRVLFPQSAPWYSQFQDELLKFPNATQDDCVDALSWVGIKVMQMWANKPSKKPKKMAPRTWGWLKKEMEHQRRLKDASVGDGW